MLFSNQCPSSAQSRERERERGRDKEDEEEEGERKERSLFFLFCLGTLLRVETKSARSDFGRKREGKGASYGIERCELRII